MSEWVVPIDRPLPEPEATAGNGNEDTGPKSFIGVELVKVGTWGASTGELTLTRADLAAAVVASHDLPAPPLRIGHEDPRFSGDPALGKVVNIRLADHGTTLVGDLVDVPPWLADAAPTHFSQRSIEGVLNFQTNNQSYRFALTAVALLGASMPAVTNLSDLQQLLEKA